MPVKGVVTDLPVLASNGSGQTVSTAQPVSGDRCNTESRRVPKGMEETNSYSFAPFLLFVSLCFRTVPIA
jgi:hypothetical protein